MAHAARALDLGVMLGCMVESGFAIAAGAQIASLMDHVDLDGNLLLAGTTWPGVEFRDGVQLPANEPDSVSEKRYLVLAEGKVAGPRHPEAARGVLRYGREPVSRSSTRRMPGRRAKASRRRERERRALLQPDDGARRRRHAGRRFPPVARAAEGVDREGLDLENGLHEFVSEDDELVELARRHGVELHDLRKPPPDLNVPTGANLDVPATIALTVGSDCAIGKMTVSLELDRAARERGLASEFVPTGQTGIAIAGWGIAVDAVVSDFIAGPPSSSSSRATSGADTTFSGSRARARWSTRPTRA